MEMIKVIYVNRIMERIFKKKRRTKEGIFYFNSKVEGSKPSKLNSITVNLIKIRC